MLSRMDIRRHERGYRLECEQLIDVPLDAAAEFFESPENLETITPPFLNFEILTPRPIAMRDGARIEYRVKLFGVPMLWRSRIEGYEKGRAFTDVAERSPYAYWIHRHEFSAEGARRTRVRDRVDYAPAFGPLGRVAHALFVRRMLERIFAYRCAKLDELFPAPRDGAAGRA